MHILKRITFKLFEEYIDEHVLLIVSIDISNFLGHSIQIIYISSIVNDLFVQIVFRQTAYDVQNQLFVSIHRPVSLIVMLSNSCVLLRSAKLHNAHLVLVIAPAVCGSLCNNCICSRCRCSICSRCRLPVSTITSISRCYSV